MRLQNGSGFTGDAHLGLSAILMAEDDLTFDTTTIDLEGNFSRLGVSGTNTLTLGPGAVVNLRGGGSRIGSDLHLNGDGEVVVEGMIIADADGSTLTMTIDPDVFTVEGVTLEVRNGATLSIPGGYVQNAGPGADGVTRVDGGEIRAQTSSTNDLIDIQSGVLEGDGTVTADVLVGDTLSVGLSAGSLVVNGDLTLGAASQSIFEVGGVTPGTEFDLLDVNGDVTLGGDLVLSLIGGSGVLTDSDVLTILTSDSPLTGAFSNVASGERLTVLGGGGSFRVDYLGNDVVLSAFVPEPGAAVGLALGGMVVGLRRRR